MTDKAFPSEVSMPPPILPPVLDNIPEALTSRPQWVLWRAVLIPDKGKYNKPPVQPNGKSASTTDPRTWATFAEVCKAYRQNPNRFAGIGFVLFKGGECVKGNGESDTEYIARKVAWEAFEPDPFFGVDFDHVNELPPDEKKRFRAWVSLLDTYGEVSPSGKGIRLFGEGRLPSGSRKHGDIESYETGRFLTVTGRHLPYTPNSINVRQAQAEQFHREAFHASTDKSSTNTTPNTFPKQQTPQGKTAKKNDTKEHFKTNHDLLTVAFSAKNGDKISALYRGDWQVYPSLSEAVAGLLWELAFYTKDPTRLDTLFRGSGLFPLCDKWEDARGGDTWGSREIAKAIASVTAEYEPSSVGTLPKSQKQAAVKKAFSSAPPVSSAPIFVAPNVENYPVLIIAGSASDAEELSSHTIPCIRINEKTPFPPELKHLSFQRPVILTYSHPNAIAWAKDSLRLTAPRSITVLTVAEIIANPPTAISPVEVSPPQLIVEVPLLDAPTAELMKSAKNAALLGDMPTEQAEELIPILNQSLLLVREHGQEKWFKEGEGRKLFTRWLELARWYDTWEKQPLPLPSPLVADIAQHFGIEYIEFDNQYYEYPLLEL